MPRQIELTVWLTLNAMQRYVKNRLAVQSHKKVTLGPKKVEALDLKSAGKNLATLPEDELHQVAKFAKKWLGAYRSDPTLVPDNSHPADPTKQDPTWQSEVHKIVLSFAKAHPDLMDEEIGAHHTPQALKLPEFGECARSLGYAIRKDESKQVVERMLVKIGDALANEIYANPQTRLLFETSNPKAFKRILFREFLEKSGSPARLDRGITFLQFCRRIGAAADYLYLDVLGKMPDRLEQDHTAQKARLLEQMHAGKRGARRKASEADMGNADVLASGFRLGNARYTRAPNTAGKPAGDSAFTVFQDPKGNRVAARTIPKTIAGKPNPDYEKQLAALRTGARLHSQVSAMANQTALKSLAILPGPNGELVHVVEMPYETLDDMATRLSDPTVSVTTRLNAIKLAFTDAVEAVAGAHAQNLIHQGLSASSFQAVERSSNLRFRLANLDTTARGKVQQLFDAPAASLDYAAPELVALRYEMQEGGYSDVVPSLLATQKADMWALGVLLFRLHAGLPPFKAADLEALNAAMRAWRKKPDLASLLKALAESMPERDRARFRSRMARAIPPDVHKLILQLLSPNPADRPTATDLLRGPYFALGKPATADARRLLDAPLRDDAGLSESRVLSSDGDASETSTDDEKSQVARGPRKAEAPTMATHKRMHSYKSSDRSFPDSHVRNDDESNSSEEDITARKPVPERKRSRYLGDSSREQTEMDDESRSIHISGRGPRGSQGSDTEKVQDKAAPKSAVVSQAVDVALQGVNVEPSQDLRKFMSWSDQEISWFAGASKISRVHIEAMIQYLKFFSGDATVQPKMADVAQFALGFTAYVLGADPVGWTRPIMAAVFTQVDAFYGANPQLREEDTSASHTSTRSTSGRTSVDEESDQEGTNAEESSSGEPPTEGAEFGTTRIAPDAVDLVGGTTRLLNPATGGTQGGGFAAAVSRAAAHFDEFNQLDPGLGKQPRQFTRITTNRNDVFTPPAPRTTTAATTAATTATKATTAATASAKTAAKDIHNLKRFVTAQASMIDTVFKELKNGEKKTHWIWYIFPQIAGLGSSEDSKLYAIANLNEAKAYLAHPVLGLRLRECCQSMLNIDGKSALQILGRVDSLKFKSCLTLFARATDNDQVFGKCLTKYFGNIMDSNTLAILGRQT